MVCLVRGRPARRYGVGIFEKLIDIQKKFLKAFPGIRAKTTKNDRINFSDEKEYMFAILQTLILTKSWF